MSLAEELLERAQFLASDEHTTSQANIRRAISASYYAVFHLLSAAVAEQVSPDLPAGLRECTQRALSHSQMFVLPNPISAELASVASDFQELQEARHAADYD